VGVVLLVTKLSMIRSSNYVLSVDFDKLSGTKLSKIGTKDLVDLACPESKSRDDNAPETSPDDRMLCHSRNRSHTFVIPEWLQTNFLHISKGG
jgi:hypothetical protein